MSLTRKRASPSPSKNSASASDSEGSREIRAPKKAKLGDSNTTRVKLSKPKNFALQDPQTDDDGNPFWALNSMSSRRIGVSTFKGKIMIGLREYYEKDEKWLPGKKGISLPVDQFIMLVEALPHIERTLAEKGVTLPRPKYEGSEDAGEAQPSELAEEHGVLSKKLNHEATSDEDEE